MRRLVLAGTFVLLFVSSQAQINAWHSLYNIGILHDRPRLEDVCFTKPGVGYCVSLNGRLYKTTDGAQIWLDKLHVSAALRAVEFLDDDSTGATSGLGSPGGVFRTLDAGETWTDISTAVPDVSFGVAANDARQICGLSHFGNTFYGVGWWGARVARFYKSTDKGVTWSTTYIDSALATCLVDVCFTSADTGLVTGGRNVRVNNVDINESVILRTVDGGITWTKVFSEQHVAGRIWKVQFVDKLHGFGSVEPMFSDTVAMVKTTDGGLSWQFIGTGFRKEQLLGNGVGPTQGVGFVTPLHGWLGGWYNGVFETKDGGQTWDSIYNGRNFNRIFVVDTNLVWAAGSTIYRWGDSTKLALEVKDAKPVPLPHRLYPVAPNPASGNIPIQFELSTATNVVLQVLAIDGRHVYNVAASRLKPGRHIYHWNSNIAPPGQYVIWLGTDEIPVTQRFVVR